MNSTIDLHKTEAANLALEYHYKHTQRQIIDKRLEEIDQRMRELNVIIKTAEHAEAEKQQALKEQREQLTKPEQEGEPKQGEE